MVNALLVVGMCEESLPVLVVSLFLEVLVLVSQVLVAFLISKELAR